MTYSRRQVLHLCATTAAAGTAVAAGLLLVDRDRRANGALAKVRDHRVSRPAGAVDLAIARGADPAANVRRALEALGGMAAFVRRGERVLIKPNVGWNRLPEQAANTNPEVVAEVVRLARAAGASRVLVADVPVNDAERCFERSGIRTAASAAGAAVVLPRRADFRPVDAGGRVLHEVDVLGAFLEADRIINVPVVKRHALAVATLSLKNWYGVLGGHRALLHQDIHRAVVELAAMMKPTLTVLDGTRVMLANGPSGGSLDDVKRMDTVAVGVDEVALDAFGATLLGLEAADVGAIAEGEKAGLGKSDYRSLKLEELGG